MINILHSVGYAMMVAFFILLIALVVFKKEKEGLGEMVCALGFNFPLAIFLIIL